MTLRVIAVVGCLWGLGPLWSQTPLTLTNASFEGVPTCCKTPFGWRDCGFLPDETPPDIQPSGQFQVTRPAMDGRTYLGMVVRENDTWERVSQQFSRPMEAGICYEFSIHLCRSMTYLSALRDNTLSMKSFTKPAVLRIWAGTSPCDRREMLAQSISIENTEWKKYIFKLRPKGPYTYLILEAFYKTPTPVPYNGNVLLDLASDLVPIPCETNLPIMSDPTPAIALEEGTKINQAPPVNRPPTKPSPDVEPEQEFPVDIAPAPGEKIMTELEQPVKVGQTIRLRNLYFRADSSGLDYKSYPVLNEVFDFLQKNKRLIVEIGGHTNGLPDEEFCNQLSAARAKEVVDYLTDKGLPEHRIKYRGYGKSKPIASDKTPLGRQRNQRVEIKILSTTG